MVCRHVVMPLIGLVGEERSSEQWPFHLRLKPHQLVQGGRDVRREGQPARIHSQPVRQAVGDVHDQRDADNLWKDRVGVTEPPTFTERVAVVRCQDDDAVVVQTLDLQVVDEAPEAGVEPPESRRVRRIEIVVWPLVDSSDAASGNRRDMNVLRQGVREDGWTVCGASRQVFLELPE